MADSILQSIVDVCDLAYDTGDSWKETQTFLWVLSQIDFKKLTDRVQTAMENTDKDTKVVLFEYNYTTKKSVSEGKHNICDKLPSGVLVHDALYRKEFIELMDEQFSLNDDIVWYRRRKIGPGGVQDPHRMQVVLHFKAGALAEEVDDDDVSSSSSASDSDMPPLIRADGAEVVANS